MKRFFTVILLVGLATVTAAADTSEVRYFNADLSVSAEVPPVTDSQAVGTARIAMYLNRSDAGDITSAVVDFAIEYYLGQEEELVAMHIHRAAAGVNGPIVISSGGLDFGTPSVGATAGGGRLFRQRVATTDIAALEAIEGVIANPPGYYVNIHSTSHRPGLIRGQLRNTEMTMLMGLRGAVDAIRGQTDRGLRRLGLIP
ncbi:MAG: CHRD domain-containing protein [Acidobacteria bacterium]|nr:CHRD domain-containing protein [Acidobacteriota bacterium]